MDPVNGMEEVTIVPAGPVPLIIRAARSFAGPTPFPVVIAVNASAFSCAGPLLSEGEGPSILEVVTSSCPSCGTIARGVVAAGSTPI
jgi:hypothetical protein